ncbi:glycosyltransferase family 39 protein [Desulfobacula phenolica]|uniref:Dolichyl-phosphate-mannose-protein mannosyltransferase n=1 Tax=Desulfobacula phenolica TaxID=90732 RepID=A0A1H2DMS5_9BACT|nr:glycosyltransferase family 39 protein [Desulfobacula phenolica]SDT84223.1 Dolichyl-phosphate-mannose-protein mannosyltransferase [Desulfobacula phenolica]
MNWICLGIPLVVSLIVKLILLSILHQATINMDGILYINAARQYAVGNMAAGLAMYPMPAYPMLISLTHKIIPNWIVAGYFISITSMVLATVPLYYLTKTMFGMKEAFWASLIFALLPKMNEWSLYVSRDPFFLLISAWFIYVGLKSSRKTDLFLFGITFILAWTSILIRIEGLIFVFFYAGVLMYRAFAAKEHKGLYFLKFLIWLGVPLGFGLITLGSMGCQDISVNRFNNVYASFVTLFNGDFLNVYFEIYSFFSEAEKHPPFSGWHYNFAALSRHYLLIIYMMGMMEVLIKLISPLSCIPLYMALKERFTAQGKFTLWLFFMFIAVFYYSLLVRDFIATRFLMIPAFLLLPWVGAGINKLWIKRTNAPHKVLTMIILLSLLLAPAVKTFCLIRVNDNTIPCAVKWLAKKSLAEKITIVTNDKKVLFYAGMETEKNPNWNIQVYDNKDFKSIETFAMDQKAGVIILKRRLKKNKEMPCFDFFKEIATFANKTDITAIYVLNS